MSNLKTRYNLNLLVLIMVKHSKLYLVGLFCVFNNYKTKYTGNIKKMEQEVSLVCL